MHLGFPGISARVEGGADAKKFFRMLREEIAARNPVAIPHSELLQPQVGRTLKSGQLHLSMIYKSGEDAWDDGPIIAFLQKSHCRDARVSSRVERGCCDYRAKSNEGCS